jgi:serine/threonine protein kinase/tetratricopeptide (TPR) repeat protein
MRFNLGSAEVIDRRYIMQKQLGKGGMGAVYEAYDRLTGESLALKLVTAPPPKLDFASRSEGLNLYLALAQEFKVLATLRHPNIISVINYGFDEQQRPYFTMDLLQDAQSPSRGAWGKGDEGKVRVLIQICQALSYLHRRNVIHRDLKPANVRVVGDVVKVLDFGLSINKEQDQVESEHIVGTIEYMAPELLRQNPPTIESDLYALGVLGWELFTGQYLFDAPDIRELAKQIFNKIPDPNPIKNPPVAAVLSRLMAKDPAERYHSADEVIRAFCEAIKMPVPTETAAIRESYLQSATLVGREDELQQLEAHLESARKGAGNGFLIAGESGVGKSRLLDELRILALIRGTIVLRGESSSQGRTPFQVWRDPLRVMALSSQLTPQEAAILKGIVPDIDKLLEMKLADPEDLDPQAALRRIIEVVEKMVRQQTQPMVLILEDLHWEGIESFTLLDHLVRIMGQLPILIIGSYRDDERADLPDLFPKLHPLKLERLEQDDIEALVVAMLGEGARSQGLFKLLKKETEGNVFFLVEILRSLADEVGTLSGISTMTLPTHVFTGGIDKIIQRRLKRVSGAARPFLEVAAVRGRYLDFKLLDYLIQDRAQLEEWVTQAANVAVLDVQDGYWRFAHEKLRDGVIKTMTPEARAENHRMVASAMETVYLHNPEQFTALAYHWAMAGDREKEGHYAALGGEQVLRNGSYKEATVFLKRALEIMPTQLDGEQVKRRANLTRSLGLAYQGLNNNPQAKQIFTESLQLYEEADYKWGMASALSDLGHVCYATQDYEESYRHFRNAIETAMNARAQKVALGAVVGIAKLMAAARRYEWAIELSALVKEHVAVDQPTALRAEEVLKQLKSAVDASAYQAALAKGKEKTLREAVDELL